MIKHIVVWDFPEADKPKQMNAMKSLLEGLPDLIPEILSFEVGLNLVESERSRDMVLVSEFESLETLKIYAQHPEHQRVVKELNKTGAKAIAIDYEV